MNRVSVLAPSSFFLLFSFLLFWVPSVQADSPQQTDDSVSSKSEAEWIDRVVFGNKDSEQAHSFNAQESEASTGGLQEPLRRLLPSAETPWKGGSMEWSMRVDPEAQNYVTFKFWGGDSGVGRGRLILFANGLQVGYRHEGDYDVINQSDDEPLAPDRFVYVTLPLPKSLTAGQNSLDLKVSLTGPTWPYGQTFEKYQRKLTLPSRGIYQAVTHRNAFFKPDPAEKQGRVAIGSVTESSGEEVIAQSKQVVIDRLNRMLAEFSAKTLRSKDRLLRMPLLAEAYNIQWTPAYQSPIAIDCIVADSDGLAIDYKKDPKIVSSDWLGASPLALAIIQTHSAMESRLNEQVESEGGLRTRREVWAELLKASVDYWRSNRRFYTNQSMIVDAAIYQCNRALQLISPDLALPEEKALGYLYESIGLNPWLGKDLPDGSSEKPYGANFFLTTRKGLSKELGYVGTYGETILVFGSEMAQLTGDQKILEQLRRIQHARFAFRYPGFDAEGRHCMKLASEIDNRTAHYPLSGAAYCLPNIRESWWLETAVLFPDDPAIVGIAQQAIADGQYFSRVKNRLRDPQTLGMMRNVDAWEKFQKLPGTGHKLPMTPGEPDFVFSDEENAVLAIKDGETQLFVNFYYRSERGVNAVARIFENTPELVRIATVRSNVEVDSTGEVYRRPNWIDRIRNKGLPPPESPVRQAWEGEALPIAKKPADAKLPKPGDWGPFVGKADFYSVRYGDYLIALNTTHDKFFTLQASDQVPNARDLVSGQSFNLLEPVRVGPLTTLVLKSSHTP